MTTRAVRDRDLMREIRSILGEWHSIPDKKGYRGSGAPGRILEDLLHIEENNQDLPDAGRWELKYTSDSSYLTLFHKDPEPRDPSVVQKLIEECGWIGRGGQKSFRHTIWGNSPRGFVVRKTDTDVRITNSNFSDIIPRWDIDILNNAAVSKLRNMILVFGSVRGSGDDREVIFKVAHQNEGFRFSEFVHGLVDGWVAIDFDARFNDSGSIRNHGTKFRIQTRDLAKLYRNTKRIRNKED